MAATGLDQKNNVRQIPIVRFRSFRKLSPDNNERPVFERIVTIVWKNNDPSPNDRFLSFQISLIINELLNSLIISLIVDSNENDRYFYTRDVYLILYFTVENAAISSITMGNM